MAKDHGWGYLNFSGDDFDKNDNGSYSYQNSDGSGTYYGADGSYGYKNSDGSGTYYGADGSYGYKNSDGSGTYYGADGSYGYKNSDGSGTYYGADGSYGYKNSDGSGTYYGADGSYGYSNSDGSGNYYGADGSYGYKNSDGSGTYYGTDGSYGYSNSDGSGTYYGGDGSYGYKNSDGSSVYYGADTEDEYDHNSDYSNESYSSNGSSASLGDLLGMGLSLLIVSKFVKSRNKTNSYNRDIESSNRYREDYLRELQKEAEKERKQAEKERKRAEKKYIRHIKRKAFIKRHWIGILLSLIIMVISGYAACKYYININEIEVGFSDRKVIGMHYSEAVEKFSDAGFTNVYAKPTYDLAIGDADEEFTVAFVSINGTTSFKRRDKFFYDTRIDVYYHVVRDITVPMSSKDAKKMICEDLVSELEEAGFINISTVVIKDLIIGVLVQKGAVEEISINGDTEFSEDASYRPDAEIVITYHDYMY